MDPERTTPWLQARRGLPHLLLVLTLLGGAGCSIGPSTMTRDRFDYTAAVAESWKSQMLLNLVKLRYSDTPVFLDVGQIVSGYTVQSTFTAAGNLFNTSGTVPGVPNSSIGLGAQGQFTDRPTITYAPLMGERFARSLMTPIPPPAMLSLIQAGYPIDLVLRLVVHTINGIDNRFGGAARRRPADPEFYELLERLRRIQDAGAIDLRIQRTGRDEAVVLALRGKTDPAIEADGQRVRQLLGLKGASSGWSTGPWPRTTRNWPYSPGRSWTSWSTWRRSSRCRSPTSRSGGPQRRQTPRWVRAGPSRPSCGSPAAPRSRAMPSLRCPTAITGTGSTTATCRPRRCSVS